MRPGDGGVRAFGRLFCSEACVDHQDPDGEDYTNRSFDHEAAIYEDFYGTT